MIRKKDFTVNLHFAFVTDTGNWNLCWWKFLLLLLWLLFVLAYSVHLERDIFHIKWLIETLCLWAVSIVNRHCRVLSFHCLDPSVSVNQSHSLFFCLIVCNLSSILGFLKIFKIVEKTVYPSIYISSIYPSVPKVDLQDKHSL